MYQSLTIMQGCRNLLFCSASNVSF